MSNFLQGFTKSKSKKALATLGLVGATASQAAPMDLVNVSFDTVDALAVALLVITASAVIWGARKAISFTK